MQNNSDNKLRSFLPYIIVIGVIFLLAPALLFINGSAVTYIVLIGLLPLTALVSCAHYAMRQKSDFLLSLAAPLFFGVSIVIYSPIRGDLLRAFIYLIAYFICGYLGLTIGDILSGKSGSSSAGSRSDRPARPRSGYGDSAERSAQPEYRPAPSARPRRVNVDAAEDPAPMRRPAPAPRADRVDVEAYEPPKSLDADLYEDSSLDQSTTSDDIDAILREIHQRRGSE